MQEPVLGGPIFNVFDKDSSGTMDFEEYFQAKQALKLHTVEEKLGWVFSVFDTDGGGSIEFSEIEESITAILDLAGVKANDEVVDACISDIKRAVDEDGDEVITKEEFIEHAKKSKFITNMFLKE